MNTLALCIDDDKISLLVMRMTLENSEQYNIVIENSNFDEGFDNFLEILKKDTSQIDVFIKSNYENSPGELENAFDFVERVTELKIEGNFNLYLVIGFIPENYKVLDLLEQWRLENKVKMVINFPFKWPL
ncbi:MAG: hypothetical protein WCG55_00730 [bacterium]